MANTLTLSLTLVQLTGINISVTGRGASPGNLTASLVKIRKFNGTAFADFTTFTLSNATETTATIVADGGTFNQTDLLLVQIQENTNYSDRVYVDFAEDYVSHTATTQYEMPGQSGEYSLKFATVNEEDFSSAPASQTFDLGPKPTPANSSLALYKPYLVKYTGEKYAVTVVLNNASGTAVDGNYEVVFSADLA